MGMFDYVNVEIDCPVCGNKVDEFQSKDSDCILATVNPSEVGRFYSSCDSCNKWIEFSRNSNPKEKREKPFNLDEITELGFTIDD